MDGTEKQMKNSNINWTHHTANFWWGCMKVSTGCKFCYAETLSRRYGKSIWGPAETSGREEKIGIWKDILKWDKEAGSDGVRRRVFVSSMSDFLEDHPQVVDIRERAKKVIANLKNLDILILTKRPENAEKFLSDWQKDFPPHVWMGTSVENQETVNERMPHLANIESKIHFLSCEPLLEEIDLRPFINPRQFGDLVDMGNRTQDEAQELYGQVQKTIKLQSGEDYTSIFLEPFILDWVIVGGESGSKSRPFDWSWARKILNECKSSNTAFWMKQGGGHPNKREDFKDIPEDLRIRELPESTFA